MFLVNSSLFAKRGYSIFDGSTGTYSGYPNLSSLITTDPKYYQFNWTCPEGVHKISVVAIGGGGGGSSYRYSGTISNPTFNGGAGGGLAWVNDITVTPGLVYTVVVSRTSNKTSYATANTGYDSYFKDVNTVKGGGATASTSYRGVGGTYLANSSYGTYGGGSGGNGGAGKSGPSSGAGGGGGAGGYLGSGGIGGYYGTATNGNPGYSGDSGSGAGGGGGTGILGAYVAYAYNGGGVGIYGLGATGAGGLAGNTSVNPTAGDNGSGGGWGWGGQGGSSAGSGGAGAVRIIWGAGRAFPSKDVSGI